MKWGEKKEIDSIRIGIGLAWDLEKKVSDSNSEEEEKEGRKIVFSAFILLEKFEFEFA